jgi:Tol biopolymer transport system component
MTLSAGARLNHYEILSPLGAGGMGEVYLAEDTRLRRKVALKLLPSEFTRDAARVRRFEQEARAASALNHPNIITIHEIGEANGAHYIATEFIDGQTLRQRLKEKLTINAALDIAVQVAAALAAAHEAGITHRDIKPENVMLRRDGIVKVLDFGLAKLTEQRPDAVNSEAPTIAKVNTDPGTVMGTASYMSPEQARGLEVDARSDIFSFGVVLYETLTGRAPFAGVNAVDVMGAILNREPAPLNALAQEAPAELQRIVTKALRKDRDERYQFSKELLLDLKSLKQELEIEARLKGRTASEAEAQTAGLRAEETARIQVARTTSSAEYLIGEIKRHKTGVVIGLALLLACVGLLAYGLYRLAAPKQTSAPFQNIKLTRLTSVGNVFGGVSISPDGKFITYVQQEAGQWSLWTKAVATGAAVQIVQPTEAALSNTTFSPDGNYIYYLSHLGRQSSLYQIPVIGGTPKKALTGISSAITFSPDGKRFAFARNSADQSASELVVVNVDGSNERILATRKLGEAFRSLSWSPDGKIIAAAASSFPRQASIFEVTVNTGEVKPLLQQTWGGISHVAWLKDGSGLVMTAATELGPASLQIWHVSYPGAEVRRITNDLASYISLSLTADNSALVTHQAQNDCAIWVASLGAGGRAQQLTFRRNTSDGLYGVRWTPDGRIIYTSRAGGNPDLWIMNADGSQARQLTDDPAYDFAPVVSPDGRYIVFTSFRSGDVNLWRTEIDGSNPKQLSEGGSFFPLDLSPDGRRVVFERLVDGFQKIYKVSIDGGSPTPLTDGYSRAPAISPDGKLIACISYVPLSPQSNKLLILAFEGGVPVKTLEGKTLNSFAVIPPPRWSPDGRSLIYVDRRQGVANLWRLPLDGGAPQPVTNFKDVRPEQIWRFDLSRDGKQLVIARGTPTSDVVLISAVR